MGGMTTTRTQGYEQTQPEPLLRVADVLQWLGCSKSTLYRIVRDRGIEPIYLDSHPRFDPDDVRALIVARRGGHAS